MVQQQQQQQQQQQTAQNMMIRSSSTQTSSDDDDPLSSVLVLSNAFIEAQGMDVNAYYALLQHSATTNLQYFCVDTTWFRNAYPYLTLKVNPTAVAAPISASWSEELGSIVNHQLDDDSLHPSDFVLVGENVWLLLSRKFGCDKPLSRGVQRRFGKWVVLLSESQTVEIPVSGRFPYEQFLGTAVGAAAANNNADADSVDLFPSIRDSSPDPVDSNIVSNNIDEDSNDLLSDTANPNEDAPILLLPASTTTSRFQNPQTDDSMRGDNDDEGENQSSAAASETTVRLVRRRYGSGLANLGNTCYMNSTLQCLAHTEPLSRYFLTGDFQNDLNRDNPLGTGGKLAMEFARLLADMWGSKLRVPRGSEVPEYAPDSPTSGSYSIFSVSNHTIYPRKFKETIGNHAEQFRGYEQHDSQELAACLLDALHEDCNRVTKKPYIEKPEQAEGETDLEAANKAWELHLKREDSRVLENFMGQIKSRLQCNTEGCERVSTTFDPFMYLSVPIPGSEERTLSVTYVPLDPDRRPIKLAIKINKTASLEEFVQQLRKDLPNVGLVAPPVEDLSVCDIWKHNIFKWYKVDKESVEEIRDTDETLIYELEPLSQVRQIEEQIASNLNSDDATAESLGIRDIKRSKLYQLDAGTLTQLNKDNAWEDELQKYLKTPLPFITAFNPNKGKAEDRVRIYRRLSSFIGQCHQAIREHETSKQNGDNPNEYEHATSNGASNRIGCLSVVQERETIPEIVDKCDLNSNYFKNVKSKHDVAVLEFLFGKLYRKIMEMERQRKEVFPDGVLVDVRFRKGFFGVASPLVLRISSDTTVFDLRNLIAHRFSRALKADQASPMDTTMYDADDPAAMTTTMNGDTAALRNHPALDNMLSNGMASPGSWLMRKVPLSYERKSPYATSRSPASSKPLGSVAQPSLISSESSISFAEPDHPEEQKSVAQIVRDGGTVYAEVSDDVVADAVDIVELEAVDEPQPAEDAKKEGGITVLDCIDKFCQMEQLEESEQWYCSKCKDHVCAWKQTHIYRSPPYLIIHLKRFQFTHRTHRRSKIGTFVDFPLEGLDLTKQVIHYADDEKPIYDCYGVSNHYGGLGGGHYTAYCKHDDGVWCYYDDSRITQNVEPKEVVTDAAYVLYYRRRDLPRGQPYELKLPTPEVVTASPTLILQDPLADSTAASGDPASEMSSSANMVVDEEDGGMDLRGLYDVAPQDGSRSTSPASDNAAHDEYSFEEDLSSHGGDVDEHENNHGTLPLQ